MSELALQVELREELGKGVCRRLRAAGRVPAVVFGRGMTSVPVSLNTKELTQAIAQAGGANHIFSLKGAAGLEGAPVIVSEILRDRFKGIPLHVDLHKVNMAEKVKVKVPVNLVGTAIGAKEGGLVDFSMHELEVECLPAEIPEHIDVDITEVALGHSLHVGDVVAPSGVVILDDPSASVVSILGRKAAEEVESPEATPAA
ncbi:50S ribosomal protein L25 [Geomonas sp. RF6]|uniref:50S ribosomal protein L25 n=1 Tax=Geomonas sp. RF6 TaxID=2897342 RepID=UPI001E4F702A|nr:50S ribosomal protein L25 [Geomonas sp. RF6]UFS68884.1 50S ribosomal protein L25 [Geomonas sp. RF6]